MKIKLLLLSLLFFSAFSQAQITKAEAYIPGNKLSFYPGQCNNTIPEAAGKLTFCDANGALGVVEESLGLNGRNITQMLDNRANTDEVFITTAGLSIKKADGSYENVPNIAIPDLNSSDVWQNDKIFRGGLVMPNNSVLFGAGNGFLNIYNRGLKTISRIELPDFRTPTAFAYDDDRNVAWIIARQGSFQLLLYSFNETNGLILKGELPFSLNASQLAASSYNSPTLTYRDNHLYFGSQTGLQKINVDNLSLTTYNSTSSPSMPHDVVNDLKFDINGNLWLATSNTNSGSILNFNTTTETYEQYELPNANFPQNSYKFSNLAIDESGIIWSTATNYSGLIKLEFNQNVAQWQQIELLDLPQLGVNLLQVPDNIYFRNDKFYFTTFSASPGSSITDEIIINDDDNWSSITDNTVGNTSYLSSQRFSSNLPDSQGGMWWFNSLDDIIVHRDTNDAQFVFTEFEGVSDFVAIDVDDKPVTRLGFPSGKVQKIDTPTAYDLSNATNQNVNGLVRYKDQIWWYNESNLTLNIIAYNQVITTFNLDTSYDGIFAFEMDSNGKAWFSKNNGTTRTIKKFDPITETTEDFVTENVSNNITKIISAVNGTMWFMTVSEIIYYDGTNFTEYISNNIPELYSPKTITVDEFNNAYVLLNDPAAILKIENAGTQDISFSTTILEDVNSVLPALDHYRPSDLSIDSQGNIWTHASQNTFKLIDNDTATEYTNNGETFTFSGLIYNDINENNVFDLGEEYPRQLVALKINGTVYTTYTKDDGIYNFFLYEENSDYEIILPTLSPYVDAESRQLIATVGNANQNYDGNNFRLTPRFTNSLLVKTTSKQGAWGFSRTNFENTFTTAIGNISETKTYNDVEVIYTFENIDENSSNILPNIDAVNVYELDPNGDIQLIQNISIYSINNEWSVGLDPSNYTQTQLSLTPDITDTSSKVNIKVTIPTVSPFNTYIIEVKTALFDPSEAGTILSHGVTSIASNDFLDINGNTIDTPIILSPYEDRDATQSGFDISSDGSAYIDPNEIYVDPPNANAKQVYGPLANRIRIYSSYDPNDKLVDEGISGEINDRDIDRKWLTYTIRFENQGNFSAKDIVITDLLDTNLDPNSLMVIEASDSYSLDILRNANDERILKFNFNDIFLPFDDANNDGYIKFAIKVKSNVAENTIVNNQANIYFDQNPAIITNIIQVRFLTIETLGLEDETTNTELNMYPNPTNSIVHIDTKLNIYTIEVFSLLGRKIMETKETRIDVSGFASGTYIIKVKTNSGSISKKLIVD